MLSPLLRMCHALCWQLVGDTRPPMLHISQFYPRPGTVAAKMKQLPSQVRPCDRSPSGQCWPKVEGKRRAAAVRAAASHRNATCDAVRPSAFKIV